MTATVEDRTHDAPPGFRPDFAAVPGPSSLSQKLMESWRRERRFPRTRSAPVAVAATQSSPRGEAVLDAARVATPAGPAASEPGPATPPTADRTPRRSEALKLDRLARRVDRCQRRSLGAVRDIGRILAAVKARLGHGRFGAWVRESCGFKERTAREYMAVARDWPRIEAAHEDRRRARRSSWAADLSLRGAMDLLRASTPATRRGGSGRRRGIRNHRRDGPGPQAGSRRGGRRRPRRGGHVGRGSEPPPMPPTPDPPTSWTRPAPSTPGATERSTPTPDPPLPWTRRGPKASGVAWDRPRRPTTPSRPRTRRPCSASRPRGNPSVAPSPRPWPRSAGPPARRRRTRAATDGSGRRPRRSAGRSRGSWGRSAPEPWPTATRATGSD